MQWMSGPGSMARPVCSFLTKTVENVTRIKICGICRVEDALAASEMGADALGFIAVPGGPRYLSPDTYNEISQSLPLFVKRVVVTRRAEEAEDYLAEYVQHYEDIRDKSRFRRGVQWRIRAFRVRDAASLQEIADYPDAVGAVLLDAYHAETLGGAGVPFNWELARRAKALTDRPLLLAGGLTPDNVADALETVRPYGVDVSSGIERAPGIKDHARMRAFICAVREWDLGQRH